MERIGVRELRQNASKYLALVKLGQVVEVTERGVLIAHLVPPQPTRQSRDLLISKGLLIAATGPSARVREGHAVLTADDQPANQELLAHDLGEQS